MAPNASGITYTDSALSREVKRSLEAGLSLWVMGGTGIGKSAEVNHVIQKTYPKARTVQLPLIAECWVITAPSADGMFVENHINEELLAHHDEDGNVIPYVIIVDDALQTGDPAALDLIMQAVLNGQLQDTDLKQEGLLGFVLIDNDSAEATGKLVSDTAVLSRPVTVRCDASSTNWRWALAEQFPRLNLEPLFKWYMGQGRQLHDSMNPRVLEHILTVGEGNLPLILGVPLNESNNYRPIVDSAGQDITEEVLNRIAKECGFSNPPRNQVTYEQVLEFVYRGNHTLLAEGTRGIGKTEIAIQVRDRVVGQGQEKYYFNIPTTPLANTVVAMPSEAGIRHTMVKSLAGEDPKAMILDEVNRCSARDLPRIGELANSSSIDGQKIANRAGLVALRNPATMEGGRTHTTRFRKAQAERFVVNMLVTEDDINANEYLIRNFGQKNAERLVAQGLSLGTLTEKDAKATFEEHKSAGAWVAEQVVAWWREDLTESERAWMSPRDREKMMRWVCAGGSARDALLPLMGSLAGKSGDSNMSSSNGDHRAPVSVHALNSRLAHRPLTSFRKVVADIEQYVTEMEREKAEGFTSGPTGNIVRMSIENSEPALLEGQYETLKALHQAMSSDQRRMLVRSHVAAIWLATSTCMMLEKALQLWEDEYPDHDPERRGLAAVKLAEAKLLGIGCGEAASQAHQQFPPHVVTEVLAARKAA